MTRREMCGLLAALFCGASGWVGFSRVCSGGIGPGQQIELRDMLNKGLKARRPSEFQFTNKIVGLVADGTLPETMVTQTFLWARRRSRNRYAYFQAALVRRVKKELNIDL